MADTNSMTAKMALAQHLAETDPPIFVLATRQSTPRESEPHHHSSGQLLGMYSGLLSVRTSTGFWVIPTTRALWVPPSQMHSARSHGPLSGWGVYVAQRCCGNLPAEPRAIAVSALLRQAVTRAAAWDLTALISNQQNVVAVILDEIADSPADEFRPLMPHDPRLVRIAAALIDTPADGRTLEDTDAC